MLFFSIIIPTYNRRNFIKETIDSALAQTYSDFEVIIVDDGSTDNTGEFISHEYATELRVKYFFRNNEERGAARNYGLRQAGGDYAVFFDSDDWMLPHYLETLQKVIEANPGIVLLAGKYNYTSQGRIENHPDLFHLTEGWYNQSLFFKGNILACNYCIKINGNHYKLFRSERELASMEDWLFLLENLEKNKIFIKDEICITMRQHDERSMGNNQKVIAARKKANDWALKNIPLSKDDQKTLTAWSHYFCGIHQYLDNKRGASVKEAIAAIKGDGIHKQFLLLLAKSIIGRKLIRAIK